MALVRVQPKFGDSVYLGPHGGHRKAGEEFEYSGPSNPNLEPVKKSKAEAEPAEAAEK